MARSVLAYGRISATGGWRKAATLLTLMLGTAGCSLTLPFEGGRSASLQADPEITGSIAPRAVQQKDLPPGQVSPFSPKLDEEDWRRAKAAMGTALDPQGNGGHVRWENTDSGAKGSFAPIGNAFLIKDDICRIFVAMVSTKDPDQWFQGSACRTAPGEWLIKDVNAWKKPT